MSVPAVFDYHPAKTLDEAIGLLQQYGDEAKILAGGHSLIPTMKLRLAQPAHLIDIGRIDGLAYIREESGAIAVGATTTYTQIARSALLRANFALLSDAASVLGDQQVRNRGTIGGSIAHSDPAGDMPGVVLALKAEVVVQGPHGRRVIKADDFFVGTFETALSPDELITEIRIPTLPARTGTAYIKLENKASHYSLAGCAAVISLEGDGICNAASLVITGSGSKTTRASAAEAALLGKKVDQASATLAADLATDGLDLVQDIHGSQSYRAQMTIVMTRRAILKAIERL